MSLEDDITTIDNLLQQIQESKSGKIDGTVLSTLLTLIYKCGLQLDEVPEIRINDLNYNENNELRHIRITDSTLVTIPDEVKRRLQDYLAYLSDKGYPSIPRSLLFPKYTDTKKIVRHLKKFSERIGINEIRKVGIKRHCYLMKEQGLGAEAAIESAASQFRIKARSVDQVIKDNIQPAGRPKPTENDLILTKILHILDDTVLFASQEKAKELVINFVDIINTQKIFSKDGTFDVIKIFFTNVENRLRRLPNEAAEKKRTSRQDKLTWEEKLNILNQYKKLHNNHTEFIELSNDNQKVVENYKDKSDDEV